MKREKLIIIVAVIIGVSILLSQSMKQKSIERQVNAKIEQEKIALDYEKEKAQDALDKELFYRAKLEDCLEEAEDAYWNYAELNGIGGRYDEDGISMAQYKWDIAREDRKQAEDNCYKRFK